MAVAAAVPLPAMAGTLFYVPIPATGSDTHSGIDPANVYTSAIGAGTTKGDGRMVNGVPFGALTASGNTSTANGVTLSAATGSLANGGGRTDSIQADGVMSEVLSGMIFNDGASDDSEQYVVLDPASLTAGKTYDLRVYICNSSGQNRQVNLSFAGDGKAAVSTDFFNEDDASTSAGGFAETNQVYYINYRYTWDGVSTPGFTITQRFGSIPFCLYALTNQEVGGDASARPEGAIVAMDPEPVAPPPASTARGTRTNLVTSGSDEDVGVASEVFYEAESLRNHGRWVTVGSYGRCWQPSRVDADWQPYTRGRWVHSRDDGWAWDSDEDFGWATYHYGRWFREENSGWYWVPGRVWAPAWVSWRHGNSRIGWAPLPPRAVAGFGVGIGVWADHRWGIGPQAYNFVNARDFGAPLLSRVIIPRQQNVTIMTNTTNITNIVNNRTRIYNGGPSYQVVNNTITRAGGQPIPSVRIDRNPGRRPLTPDGKHSQLKDGVLTVSAPPVTPAKRSAALPPIAATIKTPKIDNGWSGVADPKQSSSLKAKIANETPGDAAKKAPARMPGAFPSTSGGVGTKTGGAPMPGRTVKPPGGTVTKPGQPINAAGTTLPKPGQPAKPADATVTKPGEPVKPAAATVTRPGQPVKPADAAVTKPGQPVKPVDATVPKPGQPVKPPDATVAKRGQPVKPTGAIRTKPGKPAEPAQAPLIKPVQPVKPVDVTPPQPGQPVKPTADGERKPGKKPMRTPETLPQPGQPTKPAPAEVIKPGRASKPSGAVIEKPRQLTKQPAETLPDPTPATKRAPQHVQPTPPPAPVKKFTPPADRTPQRAPQAHAPAKRPAPAPAVQRVAPPRTPPQPPPRVQAPAKPAVQPAPAEKGSKPKPTPTPPPGTKERAR